MKNRYLLLALSCMAAFSACKDEVAFTPDYPLNVVVDSTLTVKIDASQTYQTIDGFGASGAWTLEHW